MNSYRKLLKKISPLEKGLIVLGLLGFIFITFGDYVLWFDISAADKINSTVLLWTGIAVVWYTIETYDLRKSSEKQVTLQDKIMMNEFLPILAPVTGNGIVQGRNASVEIENLGKGVARNIEFWLHGVTVRKGVTIPSGTKSFTLSAGHENIELILKDEKPKHMDSELMYEDIYGRRFRTIGLRFNLDEEDPNTRYLLDTSSWEFREV